MSAANLSSEAAQALFEAAYVVPATDIIANVNSYANSDQVYNELWKLWAQTKRGLETLPPASAHVPSEGRTIDEDLEDCVNAANAALWAQAEPKPVKIGSTQVYNKFSSIRKKMLAAAQGHDAQRAADRAAAEAHAHPPSIPMTPAKDEHAQAGATVPEKGLVASILANIKGEVEQVTEPGDKPLRSGNGQGGVQTSQVPPSLQNAAARLTTVGVTPLRKDAIGARLATGFLQEHDTLTQWVRAQGMTGHSKREALTDARALERGVADYGVGFLASTAAEILLRRILALAIHSGTNSWQIAEKIEELPTESPLSVVPESLLKEIMEQVKNELKIASLAKQAA